MNAEPDFSPFTNPVWSTDATVGSALTHVGETGVICEPLASRATTFSWVVEPFVIVMLGGSTSTCATHGTNDPCFWQTTHESVLPAYLKRSYQNGAACRMPN